MKRMRDIRNFIGVGTGRRTSFPNFDRDVSEDTEGGRILYTCNVDVSTVTNTCFEKNKIRLWAVWRECCIRFVRRTFMLDSLTSLGYVVRDEEDTDTDIHNNRSSMWRMSRHRKSQRHRQCLVQRGTELSRNVTIEPNMTWNVSWDEETRRERFICSCFKVSNYCSSVSADTPSREIHVSKLRGAFCSGRKTISDRWWGSRWSLCRLYLSWLMMSLTGVPRHQGQDYFRPNCLSSQNDAERNDNNTGNWIRCVTHELNTSIRDVEMCSRRVNCSTTPTLSAESSMTNRRQQIYLQFRGGIALHRWIIQSSTKSLSKFRTLTRGNRVGYSDSSLNIMSSISALRLPLLHRHIVNFSDIHFRFWNSCARFHTCDHVLVQTYNDLRPFFHTCQSILQNPFMSFRSNVLRLDTHDVLDGGLLSRLVIANHLSESLLPLM